MGDCEHGKLAVKTSEFFSKKSIKIKYTKAKVSWQEKKSRSIKKNSQIPTHYRNVTFNFQVTGFLKKAVQIPLIQPLTPFFNPSRPPKYPFHLTTPIWPPKHCTCFFLPPWVAIPQLTELLICDLWFYNLHFFAILAEKIILSSVRTVARTCLAPWFIYGSKLTKIPQTGSKISTRPS